MKNSFFEFFMIFFDGVLFFEGGRVELGQNHWNMIFLTDDQTYIPNFMLIELIALE